jgi:hypothetical protein
MVLNGFDPKTDIISEKYEAGPYLIYDCSEGHWVCVLKEYYEQCQVSRNDELVRKQKELSCAPIGEFPNKKSCFQRQLYMTGQGFGTRFCLSDEWKKKEITY